MTRIATGEDMEAFHAVAAEFLEKLRPLVANQYPGETLTPSSLTGSAVQVVIKAALRALPDNDDVGAMNAIHAASMGIGVCLGVIGDRDSISQAVESAGRGLAKGVQLSLDALTPKGRA